MKKWKHEIHNGSRFLLSVYRVAVNLGGEGKDMAISDMLVLASITVVSILSVMIFLLIKYISVMKRFKPIDNAEKESKRIIENANEFKNKIENQIKELQESYLLKKKIYDDLENKISKFEYKIENIEMCLDDNDFLYDDSEEYKKQISRIRESQRLLVAAKEAITCATEWHVNGSVREGRKMINESIKLTLRGFNTECDKIISGVNWRNYAACQDKIMMSFKFYNNYNESQNIKISREYLNLKIEELRLTFEQQEKRQQEKEKQRAIREQIRDEERLVRDRLAAEKEEEKYKKLLDKAKQEASKATGGKLNELQEEVNNLSKLLEEAQEKNQRAISMAQQTKSGYVYVISNVGSFGNDIFKIGMTRRLDPYDRVRELGDASVPFEFDVHAMIPCDDAPSLENKLHCTFEKYKINLINNRREFFKIPIDIVEAELKKEISNIYFTREALADQFHRSEIIKKKIIEQKNSDNNINKFPESI